MKRLLAALLLASPLAATDYVPWYPRYLEIQSRFAYAQQRYDNVDTIDGPVEQRSTNNFFGAGLEAAYAEYCGELELMTSQTLMRSWSPEYLRATLRYQLLDDVIDDPFSLVAGVSGSLVFGQAIHDIGVFHQSHCEAEFHLTAGKEYAPCARWLARAWIMGGLGMADKGAAWWHGIAAIEFAPCFNQQLRFFADALRGNGQDGLDLSVPFDGYGTIAFRAVDVGVRYAYFFDFYGSLSLAFAYRAYARNCPEYAKTYVIEFMYPFGL